ncbi:MAG: hypothetical protein IKV35_02405, partial [Clostridia bacterium]|nr:hypothetical protein [Clostridia bacterium]
MTRKIAFGITIVTTVLLMLIQLNVIPLAAAIAIGGMSLEAADLLPYGIVLVIAIIAVLCYSKKNVLRQPQGTWSSFVGWLATFTGAVTVMMIGYDIVFSLIYPTQQIVEKFDAITLLVMLIAGLLGGVMLVMQGFRWMAFSTSDSNIIPWLSLAPSIWMWTRLARYEISYASTVDISENFFTLAMPVFASLFFLQFARMLTGIGKPPKNSLLVYALATAMVGLAQAPAQILFMPDGQPLSDLLIVVADAVIALFALMIAALQVFGPMPKPVEESAPEATLDNTDEAEGADEAEDVSEDETIA